MHIVPRLTSPNTNSIFLSRTHNRAHSRWQVILPLIDKQEKSRQQGRILLVFLLLGIRRGGSLGQFNLPQIPEHWNRFDICSGLLASSSSREQGTSERMLHSIVSGRPQALELPRPVNFIQSLGSNEHIRNCAESVAISRWNGKDCSLLHMMQVKKYYLTQHGNTSDSR